MKIWCAVILCSLRVIYGCVVFNRTIDCSGMDLSNVPARDQVNNYNSNLTSEESIVIFNLSNNSITYTDISDWISEPIEVLDLSHNKIIIASSEMFLNNNTLKLLNISYNLLLRVDLDWKHLRNVVNLDLSNNPHLQGSMHIFNNLAKSKIEYLNLSYTGVILPSYNIFTGVTTLLRLDLSGNKLGYIPDLPPNLEYLKFNNNSVHHISPDCFSKDTRLKVMLLENNRYLNEIGYESFNFLVDLRYLSFKGCSSLSHLPTSLFYHNKKIEYLSLEGCNFRNISVSFKNSFMSINYIGLKNNPWHCSAHIKWFVQLHDHLIMSDEIRCATPENVSLIEYLGPKAKHKVVRILITAICVIMFCLLITAVGICCSMENKRRKTLTNYSPLDKTSKPYRGSMVYVTSSV